MDEYNTGMDAEVKVYFRKIMKSFGAGLLWLMLMAIAGLYFRLGYFFNGWDWYNGSFYTVAAITLFFLLRFLARTWRKKA